MTCRVLAVWFSLMAAIGAFAQETNRVVQKPHLQFSYPLDISIPRLVRDPDNREFKIRRHGESLYARRNGEDTTRPNYFYYKCSYTTPEGDSAKLTVYVNPPNESISFDVTKDFETLSVEGTKHCIRGNQRFTQTTLRNSYEGPFTAMFLGAFTMPYSERYPQRAGGCWGPSEFVTTSTYTAYDVSKSYLDVQSICIVIEGDPKIADMIMSKIEYATLNEAIERY